MCLVIFFHLHGSVQFFRDCESSCAARGFITPLFFTPSDYIRVNEL